MRPKHLAADQCLRSALKIIGGKTGQTKKSTRSLLYRLEPYGIENYIDIFCGSGAIVIGNPIKHKLEILNDINPLVIKFFRVMQDPDLYKDFMAWLLSIEVSKDYFESCKTRLTEHNQGLNPLDDFEISKNYYIINKFALNGIVRFNQSGKCNSPFCQTLKGRGLLTEDWSHKLHERVKDIELTNKTYQEILARAEALDPEKTLVILDPPYSAKSKENPGGCVTTYFNGKGFTKEDHEELAGKLNSAKYRWLLTIDDVPMIRELYKDCFIMDNEVFWCVSNTPKGRGKRNELIIANYDIKRQLKFREAMDSIDSQYGSMMQKLANS